MPLIERNFRLTLPFSDATRFATSALERPRFPSTITLNALPGLAFAFARRLLGTAAG
jgi:hypothetical protein